VDFAAIIKVFLSEQADRQLTLAGQTLCSRHESGRNRWESSEPPVSANFAPRAQEACRSGVEPDSFAKESERRFRL